MDNYPKTYQDITNSDGNKPPIALVLDGKLNAVYDNFLITIGGYYRAHKDFQSASGFVRLVAKF